ncbi:MAG: hydrogenase nickel incorporation protein HypB [Bacteroidia bacterium]|nr:hydrogenase nickel incorporation protein HypB [Bacteroidia bacterium]
MCGTCGCGDKNGPMLTMFSEDGHYHELGEGRGLHHEISEGNIHHHHHEISEGNVLQNHHMHGEGNVLHQHIGDSKVLQLEQDILQKNQLLAERNRGYFTAKKMFAINLISSPGSGKTSILEKTLNDLNKDIPCYVIEGDQRTLNDAIRIKETGTEVIQVNTGQGCHLESDMVMSALQRLDPKEKSLLFIENVGNLVCPSMFDLGETNRVVIMSVTEGDDKPIKYPDAFAGAQICIINKTDLLPYVNFDVNKSKEYALRVNPSLKFFEVSATSGEGLDKWYGWLKEKLT